MASYKNGTAAPQHTQTHTPIVPRHGTILLHGHVQIKIDSGHLCVQDNFCGDIRQARFPRVGHSVERIYCIDGCGGYLSLQALQWIASQRIHLTVLERSGAWLAISTLAVTSDAKLRRAQVMASENGVGLAISRYLIGRKLHGQEKVVRSLSLQESVADDISRLRIALANAGSMDAIRSIESQAARAYWDAWSGLPVIFPKSALPKIPSGWLTFGQRGSLLTGSPQRAVNPANAILNYLYAILLTECSIALSTVGLDPSLGWIHLDNAGCDSLACDVMEPVRPCVDAWLLTWLKGGSLKSSWFQESHDGQCRLTSEICSILSQTCSLWRREAVPLAERIATTLGRGPTRKTKQKAIKLKLPALCRACGEPLRRGQLYCPACVPHQRSESMSNIRREAGQVASQTPGARQRLAETQRKRQRAANEWNPTTLPVWLTDQVFDNGIRPKLAQLTTASIASCLGVTWNWASRIQRGIKRPHRRHWLALAELAGVSL